MCAPLFRKMKWNWRVATSNANITAYQPHSLDSLDEMLRGADRAAPATDGRLLSFRRSRSALIFAIACSLPRIRRRIIFASLSLEIFGMVLPRTAVVSADCMFDRLKSVKTATEMDHIRRASQLAANAFAEAERAIAPGRREDEVAADIGAAFARIASDGFERGAGYFFCMSGPNSAKAAGAYARTRRRVIEEGDLVMIHANTVGDGYWTDITRTFIAGNPSDEQKRMREAIQEARAAALAAIAPGVAREARGQSCAGCAEETRIRRRVQACNGPRRWLCGRESRCAAPHSSAVAGRPEGGHDLQH